MTGRFHQAFQLDVSAGKLFWSDPPKNHAQRNGDEAGYICEGKGKNKSYWQVRLDGKTYKRSRVVFFMIHGRWPTPCVDHINGDSLDDRPPNLREADKAQNCWNMSPRRNKMSGLPRGVTKYRDKYRAQVFVRGKRIVIGSFNSPEDASMACHVKRLEAYGEYA